VRTAAHAAAETASCPGANERSSHNELALAAVGDLPAKGLCHIAHTMSLRSHSILTGAFSLLLAGEGAAAPSTTQRSRSTAPAASYRNAAAAPNPPHAGYAPDFRRFGLYDYLVTAGVTGGFFLVEFTQEDPRSPAWTRPLPLDRPVRDALVADSLRAREAAVTGADWLWYSSVAYPVLDAAITPAVRTGGVEVSWNMTAMNIQSFMLTSLLIRMPHKWIGRTRPDSIGCATSPDYSRHCGNKTLYASFPGGHVSVSMTGAGLSCAHHLHGKLYGSPLADGMACGSALTAATLVFWLRMRSDSHWLSDQLMGTAVGLFSGYAVPSLLYYHPFWRKRPQHTSRTSGAHVTALPWLDAHTLGAAVIMVD
jgi:membrane-associated phospholipid phosphatase